MFNECVDFVTGSKTSFQPCRASGDRDGLGGPRGVPQVLLAAWSDGATEQDLMGIPMGMTMVNIVVYSW